MAFSAVLLVVFAFTTLRTISDIRSTETMAASLLSDPVIVDTGNDSVVTSAEVRFTTEDGTRVETHVFGVPADSRRGGEVDVSYLSAEPRTAIVGGPPNRTAALVLNIVFTLVGVAGLWAFGLERSRPELDD